MLEEINDTSKITHTVGVIEESVRQRNKAALTRAYDEYIAGTASVETLFTVVRRFAMSRVRRVERDMENPATTETAETADDWAQKVAMQVWKSLHTFQGTDGETFYAWVNKIRFNVAQAAANTVLEEKYGPTQEYVAVDDAGEELCTKHDKPHTCCKIRDKKHECGKGTCKRECKPVMARQGGKVSLYTEAETENGGTEEIENPAIYSDLHRREWRIRIPESIQGVDRRIVRLIMDGKNYVEVGTILNMTEMAVKKRMQKLRAHMKKEKRPGLLV